MEMAVRYELTISLTANRLIARKDRTASEKISLPLMVEIGK
jgi:hypothetical protein